MNRNDMSDLTGRILAVDDQRDSARLVQLQLQASGLECATVSSGAEALEFVRTHAVDAVILDVMMPHMDGYEVCRRLKADAKTRDIPVLFLTAKMETEEKVRGLEVGGHDFLSKPVDRQELLARTRAALRSKRYHDQLKDQLRLQQTIQNLHERMLGDHWQKVLGQLAASLAHEINNPLTVAMGCVQLLRIDLHWNEETTDRLQAVDESLQRAAKKLRSLLLIAHSRRDNIASRLDQLIEDVLVLINYDILAKKIELFSALQSDCAWVGNPGDLARALVEVLNSAIETVAGRAQARVWVRLESKDGLARIRIANNGPALTPESRLRLFQPFAPGLETPDGGVGLYLAREVVERGGGKLFLEEEPSFGSTEFTIELACLPG